MSGLLRFENVRFPEGSRSFSFSLSPGVNRLLPSEKAEREIASFLFPAGTEGKLVVEGKEFDLSRPGDAGLFLLECRFQEGGVLSSLLPVDEREGERVAKECLALEGKPLRERVMGVMSLLEGKGALYFIVEERDDALLSLVRNIYPSSGNVPLLILGEEEGRKPMPESRVRFRSGNFEREPFLKDMKLNLGEYLFQALFMFLASSLSMGPFPSERRGRPCRRDMPRGRLPRPSRLPQQRPFLPFPPPQERERPPAPQEDVPRLGPCGIPWGGLVPASCLCPGGDFLPWRIP